MLKTINLICTSFSVMHKLTLGVTKLAPAIYAAY